MTQSDMCNAASGFMTLDGTYAVHVCTNPAGHAGNHVCACSAQWPRRDVQYSAYHEAHP